jgi:hypothetical protein
MYRPHRISLHGYALHDLALVPGGTHDESENKLGSNVYTYKWRWSDEITGEECVTALISWPPLVTSASNHDDIAVRMFR